MKLEIETVVKHSNFASDAQFEEVIVSTELNACLQLMFSYCH